MKRRFNTTGICYADEHYMVDLAARLTKMKEMVDGGKYFVINRARQYGKTTTLHALGAYLKEEYVVVLMDFQKMGSSSFADEHIFSKTFFQHFWKIAGEDFRSNIENIDDIYEQLKCADTLNELFLGFSTLCERSDKRVVLIIDEVDSASNNQVFLDFLSQLRAYYLDRRNALTFHSVILAGVYDIKNLKVKIRAEETHRYNSPWNIAEQFNMNMSFSVSDILGMIEQYEMEHQTGMNTEKVAELLYEYTAGYPFLVSRVCQIMDEQLQEIWNEQTVIAAVKILLNENNTLFDDMTKKIEDFPELRTLLYQILFQGISYPFVPGHFVTELGRDFGFIVENNGAIAIANRIFEMRLYNFFMAEETINSGIYRAAVQDKSQFIENGFLNMDIVLRKFVEHYTDIYKDSDEKFLEENGRRLFLLYLKPIINGTGNYYIEARTRNMNRTDVIVDYRGKQYVIEMKIWRGEEYNRRGEEQLMGYLDDYHLDKGYLLSFNFNKKKQVGVHEIQCNNKVILEAVV